MTSINITLIIATNSSIKLQYHLSYEKKIKRHLKVLIIFILLYREMYKTNYLSSN